MTTKADSLPVEPPGRSDLRLTRLYYLVYFASLGFISPFLNLYLVHRGLSGTEIGIVSAVVAVITLIAAPFWANRNDRWKSPRGVLQILLFVTGLGYLWLSQQTLFWGIVLVSGVQGIFGAGIPALSDSLALRVTSATKTGYGSVRVYGSLGWMIFVLISGWFVERLGLESSLIGAAFFGLVTAGILFLIDKRHFTAKSNTGNRTSIRDVLGKIAANRPLIGLGLMIIIEVIAGSGVYQFQSVFLGQIGASGTVIGVAGMAASLVELPFMIWSDWLTKRWGAHRLLVLSTVLFAVLRGVVFVFPIIPVIIVAEAATGIAYSFLTVALVQVIAEQTNEQDTRTMLALYTVTLTSLIGIIAALINGVVFDQLGALSLYLIAAVGYTLACLSLYLTRPVRVMNRTK